MQRLKRERGVAHPGVAVVPVALSSRRLGQRRGQRRHCCPGRHVGQALDRQRGALDRAAPAVVGKWTRSRQPSPPELDRRVQSRGGVVGVRRGDQVVLPGQRDVYALSRTQRVASSNAAGLDPELEIGLQADRLAGTGRVGDVPVAAYKRPFGRCAPVVERRLAHQLDLDLAVQALDRADEHVLRVLVRGRAGVRGDHVVAGGRPHDQRVAHLNPAPRGLPRGDEDIGPRFVVAIGGNVDPERRHSEHARLAVEQRAEHARRVKPRDAQPVD